MSERWVVREGMGVRSTEGEWLGKVSAVGETHFELEPGAISLRDYDVSLDAVLRVRGDAVILRHGREDLVRVEDHDGGAVGPPGYEHMDDEPLAPAS